MKTTRTLAALFCTSLIAAACPGQEPSQQATIEELRREVSELRKLVAELTKKIESIEYHNLPRLDDPPRIPAMFGDSKYPFPLDIERGSAAPSPCLRLRSLPRMYSQ